MIQNISLVTVYCLDQSATRDFYVQHLGFTARVDATMGEFRWVTIAHPNQPELEVTLMVPGPPLSPEAAGFVRSQLESGQMGGLVLQEPADRPYGVEAVIRDNTGNWLTLVEPKAFTQDDLNNF